MVIPNRKLCAREAQQVIVQGGGRLWVKTLLRGLGREGWEINAWWALALYINSGKI